MTGFLCFIGEPVGTAFLMGALMVHGMGFLLYFREWNQKRLIQEKKPCENVRLKSRLAAGLLVMVMLGIVYWLAFEGLQYRWFFPLRTADGIQVIRAQKSLARLRHGEWVVFKIHQSRFAQVQIHGGLGMDRVLALPGDRVEFHGDVFAVNGNASPALTDMPREGRLIVPPDRCLVWPEQSLRIRNRFVGEQVIGIALMEIALVPESRLIGVPYPTWFGRVQKQ
ncbi:MAG: hypothetical protein SFY92_09925 [Verrucomicrobiae bacterium]|nr:hypothetical protein [Verrucomicrobiae bacterium]